MAGWDLANLTTEFDTWKAASTAIATGQEYEIAGRRLERANLEEVREYLDYLDKKIKAFEENASGGLIVSQISISDR